MSIRTICGTAVVALAMTGFVAHAQDKMGKPMEMGKEKTYTGCIEAGAEAGVFMLTHATAEMAMGKAMGKDAMKKDAMGKDAMAKDAMKKDEMGKGGMDMSTLSLASKSIDLSKHVGHKVNVTGRDDAMGKGMHAFSVSSLKMVAATCGS